MFFWQFFCFHDLNLKKQKRKNKRKFFTFLFEKINDFQENFVFTPHAHFDYFQNPPTVVAWRQNFLVKEPNILLHFFVKTVNIGIEQDTCYWQIQKVFAASLQLSALVLEFNETSVNILRKSENLLEIRSDLFLFIFFLFSG